MSSFSWIWIYVLNNNKKKEIGLVSTKKKIKKEQGLTFNPLKKRFDLYDLFFFLNNKWWHYNANVTDLGQLNFLPSQFEI